MAVINFRNPNSRNEYSDYDEQEYEQPQQDYSKKIRNHRIGIFVRNFFLIAASVVAVVTAYLYFDNLVYTSASFTKVADLNSTDSSVYMNLGGSILEYSRDGANCMDTNGNALWNMTYEMQKPMMDAYGSVFAIADYNGSKIYIANSEEILGTVETGMPIRAISVSESGEVCAVLNDTDITWIYLYDVKGNTIAYFRTTMNQTGYPLDIAISPSGEMVCISFLHADGAEMKTSVAFYNFGQVGQNVVENYVSGYDYTDQVAPIVGFLGDSSSYAITDSRIVFYSGKEIPQESAVVEFTDELQAVYANTDYVMLVFPDSTGEYQWHLEVYNAKGQTASSYGFTMDYTNIQVANGTVIINSDSECFINTLDGREKFHGSLSMAVRTLIPSKRINRMTAVAEDTIQKITLD